MLRKVGLKSTGIRKVSTWVTLVQDSEYLGFRNTELVSTRDPWVWGRWAPGTHGCWTCNRHKGL